MRGMCATIVILLSGCAATPTHQPMNYVDLNHFQIDCKRKDEQIKFLMSQLSNGDDMLMARLKNFVTPWRAVTNPDEYNQTRVVGSGNTNWLIRQNLYLIRANC